MIRKRHMPLVALFLAAASVAATDDEEMLQNLEFFKSFHLVKNLDELQESPGIDEAPKQTISKKIEVKNETH